jgi:hypothetical protein
MRGESVRRSGEVDAAITKSKSKVNYAQAGSALLLGAGDIAMKYGQPKRTG